MNSPFTRWWKPWREVSGATVLHVDLTANHEHERHARAVLDGDEQERWHRFASDRPRREFALCRAALRFSLSERLGCSVSQLSFHYRKHGKPYATVGEKPVSLGFNVSHSGRHGLIALGHRTCIGVDVEERIARRDFDGIGSMVYSPRERQSLASVKGQQKMDRFFQLWSLKEALIKALGSGFSLDPCGFEVPGAMLQGVRSSVFRFPHAPSAAWRLLDLGEPRFAAALAYKLPPTPSRG